HGIVFEKARRYGLKARAGVARLTVFGCEFLRNGWIGIHIGDGSEAGERTAEHPDAAIVACRAAYNLGSGIVGLNRVTRIKIVGTVAHHNAQTDEVGDYHGNIRIVSDYVPGPTQVPQNRPADCLIDSCVSYAAGKDENGRTLVSSERGHGIWLDTAGPRSWIRNCRSFDNVKSGVYYEWGGEDCAGGLEGNLAYGNETGVLLARRTSGAVVRNNTAVANGNGLWITGEWGGESDRYGFRDNEIYNNIAVGNGVELLVSWGAEHRSNRYHHNCFGREHQAFVSWGFDNPLDTYDALDRTYGGSMRNVEADPMLTLSETGEIAVSPASPVRGAGAGGGDLGADPRALVSARLR
ncbi:MAG TPA: right-handed parallel beta-helix repeat-containing protein, partial [Candidatus Synoicihabitans sp.]|nr:right-handed parallel beta-helix repeat-containing protein [Candidatus Synoicihabitans sp.]